MEHQHQIAVGRDYIDTVLNLSSEYYLRKTLLLIQTRYPLHGHFPV